MFQKLKTMVSDLLNWLNSAVPADTRIIRGCGWDDSNYKNKCYQRSGFGGRQEVCACESDNCNAAGTVRMSTATFGGAVLLVAGAWALHWRA